MRSKRALWVGVVFLLASIVGVGCNQTTDDYLNEGVRRYNRSDFAGALRVSEQGLKLARERKDPQAIGGFLAIIGKLYEELGNYDQVLASYEQARQIFRELRDFREEGVALGSLGNIYAELGDYTQARAFYEQAEQLFREHRDLEREGWLLVNIGNTLADMGAPASAMLAYLDALKIFKALKDNSRIRWITANIGDLYLESGKLSEALTIFQRVSDPTRLGRYYLRVGDHQQARKVFAANLKIAEAKRDAEVVMIDLIGLGLALEGVKDYAGARAAYQQAVEVTERQRERLTEPQRRRFFAANLHGFSRLEPYEGLVRVSTALQEAGEAFFWAEHTKGRLLLKAVARRSAGNRLRLPEALARQEAELISRIAATHQQMDLTFQRHNRERYQVLEQELVGLKKERETFLAQLRRDFPAYAALRYPAPIRVSDLRLRLEEVLLVYEVTEPVTLAWLIKGNKILKALTIPVSRKDLTEQVLQYRKFFEGITDPSQLSQFDPQVGKALYDLLFRDLVPFLQKGTQLIIVPDEILGILPFEALVTEPPAKAEMATGKYGPYLKGVKYLGDIYPISYAQSATALHLARTLKGATMGQQKQLLVVADPVFDLTDARLGGQGKLLAQREAYQVKLMRAVEDYFQGVQKSRPVFPRLTRTGQLAGRLWRVYGQRVEQLSGLAATEPEIRRRALERYSGLVFATHGILDEEVPYIQEPALVLTQVGVSTKEREQDGFLTLSEVMNLQLAAEVVVLMACNTGVGEHLTGEGVMGLGWAFQYAGAKAALMSLWSVEEESTMLLTEKFFTYFKQGQGPLEALRRARTDVRQAGYEHPFFWAPFILVGETDHRRS